MALKVMGLPASVPDVTVTEFAPAVGPNVNMDEARPLLFVVTDEAVNVPPPLATVNTTIPRNRVATGIGYLDRKWASQRLSG